MHLYLDPCSTLGPGHELCSGLRFATTALLVPPDAESADELEQGKLLDLPHKVKSTVEIVYGGVSI